SIAMAEVIHDAQPEFWSPPAPMQAPAVTPVIVPTMAEACPRCGTEFMIGSRFCHACGAYRPERNGGRVASSSEAGPAFVVTKLAWLRSTAMDLKSGKIKPPAWLRYLHFHEIKRWIGLPTASMVAFL